MRPGSAHIAEAFPLWAGWLAAAAGVSFAFVLLFTRLLRQRVCSRTAALSEAVEELRASEDQYRTLFESAPVGVGVVGTDGTLLAANEVVCRTLGANREDVGRFNVRESCGTTEEREALHRRLQGERALKGMEVELRRRGGETFVARLSMAPCVFQGRQAQLTIVEDVTENPRTDARLARLASAVEQAADDIVITDAQGVIQYVNPSFERTTGYSAAETVGRTPVLLKSGEHEPEFYRGLWQRLHEQGVWQGRLKNRTKDGRLILQDASIAAIRDASGALAGYVSARRDVTRQVETEAHFVQTQRLESVGTLAGGIAHDFNNILGAIMGYAEMSLARLPEDQETLRTELSRILQASRRAASLVKQILSFSREGRQERHPFQMRPLVKEVLKLLRATLPSTIEIRERLLSSGPILGDPTEIHQVVMNLCTNAGLAMRTAGGVLDVALEEVVLAPVFARQHPELEPGRYVKLTVRDTGCGMPPGVSDRVFEPFFTTRRQGEGAGLGLSVVHGIARGCGGTVTVASEVGKGTAFEVFLPAYEDPKAALAAQENRVARPGKERVLLVDDEEPLLKVLSAGLRRLGYQVSEFIASPEALETFRGRPNDFDLVITDMTMPGLAGDALSVELRKARPDIPIILATGFSENMSAERAEELGIDRFLMKPLLLSELTGAIRELFDRAT